MKFTIIKLLALCILQNASGKLCTLHNYKSIFHSFSFLFINSAFKQPISHLTTIQSSHKHRQTNSYTLLKSSLAIGDYESPYNRNNPVYEKLTLPVKIGPHLVIKGKVLNLWGLFYGLMTLVSSLIVIPVMCVFSFLSDIFGNKKVCAMSLCYFVYMYRCTTKY